MAARKQPGKLVVVTDQQGRVIGAAMPTKEKNMQVRMVPLKGQSLHEVELPKNLRSFISRETLTVALEGACLTASGELIMRELKLKK